MDAGKGEDGGECSRCLRLHCFGNAAVEKLEKEDMTATGMDVAVSELNMRRRKKCGIGMDVVVVIAGGEE